MCTDFLTLKNTIYGFDSLAIYQERGLYQKGVEISMPILTKNQYLSWLKSAANIKLSSNESVLRITYEGLTNFQSFMDFDRDSIKSLSKFCREDFDMIISDVPNGRAVKTAVPGTNIITISIRQLVVATNDMKFYTAIGRTPEFDNMHHVNVLGDFKTK